MSYDEDRDYLIRVVHAEAGAEDELGKEAVAHVVLNRSRASGFPDTIKDVIMQKHQFEGIHNKNFNISPDDEAYRKTAEIVDRVLSGQSEDPTKGALNFFAPKLQADLGRSRPRWADPAKRTAIIGGHEFFNPAIKTTVTGAQPESTGDKPAQPQVPPVLPTIGRVGSGFLSHIPTNGMSIGFSVGRDILSSVRSQRPILNKLKTSSSLQFFSGQHTPEQALFNDRAAQVEQLNNSIQVIALDPNLTVEQKLASIRKANEGLAPRGLAEKFVRETMADHPASVQEYYINKFEKRIAKEQSDEAAAAIIDGDKYQSANDTFSRPRPGLAQAVGVTDEFGEINSLNDLLNYINIRGREGAEEIEWGQFFSDVFSMENPEQFTRAMRDQYGPEWGYRIAASLVAEGLVDAGVLVIAMSNPAVASVIGIQRGAAIGKKIMSAVARATLFGASGATYQTLLDYMTGHATSAKQTLEQFGVRFVGELTMEAVGSMLVKAFKSGAKGIKEALGMTTKQITARHALPTLTPEQAVIQSKATPIFNELQNVSLFKDTAEARNIKQQMLAGRITATEGQEQLDEIRKAISSYTDIPVDEIDIKLGLGDRIWKDEFSKIDDPSVAAKLDERASLVQQNSKAQKDMNALIIKRDKAKSDKTKAKYQAAIDKVANDIHDREMQLANNAAAYDEAEAVLRVSGNDMINAIAAGRAMGLRYIGESQNRQKAVDDLFHVYVNRDQRPSFWADDPTFHKDPSLWNPTYLTKKFKDFARLAEPDALPWAQVAKSRQDADLMTAATRKRFEDMYKAAIDGLDKNQYRRVIQTLEKGAREGREFDATELAQQGLTPKEVDSYAAIRRMFKFTHAIHDRVLTREAIQQGYKFKYQGTPVRVSTTGLSPDQIKDGYVKIEGLSYSLSKPLQKEVVLKQDLQPLTSVLDFVPGYLPLVYKKPYAHVYAFDPKTLTMERIEAYDTWRSAEEAAKALQNDKRFADKVVGAELWDSTGSYAGMTTPSGSMKVLSAFDKQTLEAFKRALPSALASTPEEVDKLMNSLSIRASVIDGFSMRRTHAGDRAPTRLGGEAELLPTEEAIASYLFSVARANGYNDFRRYAIDYFNKTYADVLNPEVSSFDWASERAFLTKAPAGKDTAEWTQKLREAKRFQAWLSRALTGRAKHEIMLDNYINNAQLRLANPQNLGGKALLKVAEKTPLASSFLKGARATTATAKLLSFNLAHTFIQGMQGVVTLGANPVHGARALTDIANYVSQLGVRASGGRMNNRAKQFEFALKTNGFLSDLDIVDIANFTPHKYNSHFNVLHNSWQFLRRAHGEPFKAGEGINRLIAFSVARQDLIDQYSKGQLKDKLGNPFVGAVDSKEFNDLVVNKAKIYALNMGRSGQLELASGVGSVGLQFRSIVAKALHMFETQELRPAEKFALLGSMMALWGTAGPPLLNDAFTGLDWLGFMVTGDPSNRYWATDTAKEFYTAMIDHLNETGMVEVVKNALDISDDRFKELAENIRKGTIYTLSDGDINLINRMSFGGFIGEFVEYLDKPQDVVPFISVALAFYDALDRDIASRDFNLPKVIELYMSTDNLDEFSAKFEQFTGVTPTEQLLNDLKEYGQVFSYLGHVTKGIQGLMAEPGDAPTTLSGRELTGLREEQVGASWQRFFGITPGDEVEYFEKQDRQSTLLNLIKKYDDDYATLVSSASVNPAMAAAKAVEMAEAYADFYAYLQTQGIDVSKLTKPQNKAKELYTGLFRRREPTNVPVE